MHALPLHINLGHQQICILNDEYKKLLLRVSCHCCILPKLNVGNNVQQVIPKIHPGVLGQILSILNLCLLNLKETVCMVFGASGKTDLK